MRRILYAVGFSALLSTVALADNWSGTLLDASCYESKKDSTACSPTSATTHFGLVTSGKFYRLDSKGNQKAASALRDRADRTSPEATPGERQQAKEVMAKVEGSESSGTIEVETIEVQ